MSKHKEAICEVLKKSGPLQGSFLKERVLAFLNLEDNDYPKSTYLNHLVQLVDEFKISFEVIDNKRVYSIKNFEHVVPGGLILENLGGRIHVPNILKVFHPKLTQGPTALENKNEIHFYFEFNSTNICFSIHKDSIPIKLHISRISNSKNINEEVLKIFGSRTITLELPINKISSFKNKERSGQLLIEFLENDKIQITELGATNTSTVLKVKNLTCDTFLNEFSLTKGRTIHNDWLEDSSKETQKIKLKAKEINSIDSPSIIVLSNDDLLFIK